MSKITHDPKVTPNAENDRLRAEVRMVRSLLSRSEQEERKLNLQVSELQKKLGQIKEAVCRECSGSGEIGLADGEVACPTCGGSGDPLKLGVFAIERIGRKRNGDGE